MLKRLAILVLLLAIVQALDPAPGWASTRAGNGSGNDKNGSQGNQNTASPTPPLVNPKIQAVPADPHGSDVAAETTNTEHSVRVTSIPPITITDIHKPWWEYFLDWGQWVFAGVLAYVGCQQVRLLRRQEKILFGARKEIHTQARHMSRQADLMSQNNVVALAAANAAEESAKAANAQIRMVKDKERAHISVSITDKEFEVDVFYAVKVKIANDGTTSAFNLRAKGYANVHPSDDLPSMWIFLSLGVPSVIRQNNEPTVAEITFIDPPDLRNVDNSETPYFIHVGGLVEYDDVFGNSHQTTFRYRLKITTIQPIPDTTLVKVKSFSEWERCGSPEENHAS
jgi:hypothetical protein